MLNYNLSGTWKTIKAVQVKVSGAWKNVGQIYVKVSGVWKTVWSYSWNTGSWGDCSVDCGGGTQTRTVTCKRNDGQTVADSLCTKYVGTKPATSQECNTGSCSGGGVGGGNVQCVSSICIDWDMCWECGACVGVCPMGGSDIIDFENRNLSENCIGCMTCATACPTGAIRST